MTVTDAGLPDIANAVAAIRREAGFFHAPEYGLIEVTGNDAYSFLQSQLTNDIKSLVVGASQFTCLLDRKAHVESYFHLFKIADAPCPQAYIVIEKEQIAGLITHLEEYRFAAQVNFVDRSSEGTFFAVQGSRANKVFNLMQENVYLNEIANVDSCDIKYGDTNIKVFRHSITGENGYLFWIRNDSTGTFSQSIESVCQSLAFRKLNAEAIKTTRIESGLVKFGCDFDRNVLLPETGLLDQTVNYNKGCFVGQEVLARVKSHGMPAKAIIGLILQSQESKGRELPINSSITVDGEEIGVIKSNAFSPTINQLIAFAMLKRDYRVPEKAFVAQINQDTVSARVSLLPFVSSQPNKELAQKLYEQAVQKYVQAAEDTLPLAAIELLKEVLILNPGFDDAYEALAVILSKYNKLDEAIALMKALSQLNPDSVMAHSNLSQFYVLQGLKDAAEEEKAIALSIRMKLAAAQFAADAKKTENSNKEQDDRLKRMQMFEQVLNIDKEDFFANAGFGECLVAQNEFEKAIPYLKKAIELKAIHLPAYLDLAKAYKGSGDCILSKEILNTGIGIATKRGDTAMLQQLQNELQTLA